MTLELFQGRCREFICFYDVRAAHCRAASFAEGSWWCCRLEQQTCR
jgi:hypothetical protein